jgi:hypothetical protein
MHGFVRELGLTHAEFHRFLPPAIEPRTFTMRNNLVHIEDGERTVTIDLGPQQYRSIGSLRLPFLEARFTFSGFSEAELQRFMARFERFFQRGGG